MSDPRPLDIASLRISGPSTITQQTFDTKHEPFFKLWREVTRVKKPRDWDPLTDSMNDTFMKFMDGLDNAEWSAFASLDNKDGLLYSITPSSEPGELEKWFLRTAVERFYSVEEVAGQVQDVLHWGKWEKLKEIAKTLVEEHKAKIEEERRQKQHRIEEYVANLRRRRSNPT